MTDTFRRVVVTRHGGPEVLTIEERPVVRPGPGQVQVRVLAAGVSPHDVLQRAGVHTDRLRPPFTPGRELVGEVTSLGAGVTALRLGQRVAALSGVGAYAETIALPEREWVVVPTGLDPVEAVCLAGDYLAAYQMLYRVLRVKRGQQALIVHVADGIGAALLQLSRLFGLHTFGIAAPGKHRLVRRFDGTPIDEREIDFARIVGGHTSGGVDLAFTRPGGPLWRAYRALRPGGRVVAYGRAFGFTLRSVSAGWRRRLRERVAFEACLLAAAALPDHRRILQYRVQDFKKKHPAWYREDLSSLLGLLAARKLEPTIAARLPLAAAVNAHRLLEDPTVLGKIVLIPTR